MLAAGTVALCSACVSAGQGLLVAVKGKEGSPRNVKSLLQCNVMFQHQEEATALSAG